MSLKVEYAGAFRGRPAYDHCFEVTVFYIKPKLYQNYTRKYLKV